MPLQPHQDRLIPSLDGPRGIDIVGSETDLALSEHQQIVEFSMSDPGSPIGDDMIHLGVHLNFAMTPTFAQMMERSVEMWRRHVMGHINRMVRSRRLGMTTGESEAVQAARFAASLSERL